MPIISRIGRKDPKVRLLIGAMYVALIIGALTMIYPFLLMLSGSTKSAVDIKELDIIPRFLYDDTALYQKHVEALFNEQVSRMKATYDSDASSFDMLRLNPGETTHLMKLWQEFIQAADAPATTWELGCIKAPASKTSPLMLRSFKRAMVQAYAGDIHRMNQELGTEFVNWNAFVAPEENYLPRFQNPPSTPFEQALVRFRQQQPNGYRVPFAADGFFKRSFIQTQYSRDIEMYNETHSTAYRSYDEVRLTPRFPEQHSKKEQEDWEQFVRHSLNLLWIRVDDSARPVYQAFLKAKYGRIEAVNEKYDTTHADFEAIPLGKGSPAHGILRSDWASFIAGWKDPDTGQIFQPEAQALQIDSIDFQFRDHLRRLFGNLEKLNGITGQSYASFDEVRVPARESHQQFFMEQRSEIRREFLVRNFATVFDYLLIHGKGVRNTVIYCVLAVLSALIVNPMAAYAMSRYALPTTYKILLFMLLTMAFPPMVTQIPTFLMLRDFNLLNTFAALILPGLAHGYSIFLLKGFFDSLPRELYESAQIDGANEWMMFWNITMTLSKPILAVIALQAFNMAYSNFMFALLFCQDQEMWTLMVWLYQLQSTSGQAVMYASLLIAAIPTFIIFAFCQNIIMRGIVVPVEK